jgi:transcriptional regulator with GAF, ATPase, and Fis domain
VRARLLGTVPTSVRKELAHAGIQLSTGEDLPTIAWSARANAIPEVEGGFVWLCGAALGREDERKAALAGAYASTSVREPDFVNEVFRRVSELSVREPELPELPEFVAVSAASQNVLARLSHAGRTSMPVLLIGETGTGKDLAARIVHGWSSRKHARFVPINCAAFPNELIESELFGYTRGAFSGAVRDYDGQLVAASGGTVFLDEIDDTPPTLQAKLLRVLEDRVVSRLGENIWKKVDFRIIAATNRDLSVLIREGEFGADLYERLAIVSIDLPPLRERLEDLPALVQHMIERFYTEEPEAARRGMVRNTSPRVLELLAQYSWPGNVRELRNVIFEALVHKRAGDELLIADLPRRVLAREPVIATKAALFDRAELARRLHGGELNLRRELEALEREALLQALEIAGWSPARAARLLGEVGRGSSSDPAGTVRAMMRRLGLVRRPSA